MSEWLDLAAKAANATRMSRTPATKEMCPA